MPIPAGPSNSLDILTLHEGYTAIQDKTSAAAGSGSNDEMLQRWITALSARIDEKCGPVVIRTVTAEEVKVRGCHAYLKRRPVSSITSLVEYVGTAATALQAENFPSAVTANDYKLLEDGLAGVVERRNRGFAWPFSAIFSRACRVIATYEAGRYASTEVVGEEFKAAASSILLRLWKREAGSWAAGGDPFSGTSPAFFRAIDPMIDEFLGDQRLLRNYG